MKKILLSLALLFLVGCSQEVAKSDFYNAINKDSVSDTVRALEEVHENPITFAGDINEFGNTYELWNDGESLALFSDVNQSVKIINILANTPEEVINILSDFGIKQDNEIDGLLDHKNLTIDKESELFLEQDYISLNSDEAFVIVRRLFDVPSLEEQHKYFHVHVFFDNEVFESAKSYLLKY